jgi:DNA-binding FadR family transcriptional regulator
MEASVDDVDVYIAADMQFHAAIVRASSNEFLEQIVNVIRVALISSRRVTVQVPGSSRAALPLHLAVVDAIRSHQPQNAYQAMRHLIVRARSDIDEVMGHTNPSGMIDRG